MASPIAGNESFTTVENSVGQLDRLNVADVRAFDLVTQNLLIEDNARISSLKPSLEGLATTIATINDNDNVTIATPPAGLGPSNYLIKNAYSAGVGTTTVTLPAAEENATVVMLFTTANAGAGAANTLIVQCASGEVFLAGTTLKSAGVTVVQSVLGDNTLTYTSDATAENNLLNQGSRLYFMCTNAGVWRMNSVLNCDDNTNGGTFAFSQ